ncbi:clavaminate synthase-like protein [Tanacetum coccineum]
MSAAHCGILGLKPSFGRIPHSGLNLEAAEVVAKGQSTTQVVEDLLLLRICGKEAESRICNVEANATSSVDVYWTKKMQIQTERHSRKLWLIAMHVNGEAKLGTKLEWIGNAAKVITGPLPAIMFHKESQRIT